MPGGTRWWRGTVLPRLCAQGRVAVLKGLRGVRAGMRAAELPGMERSWAGVARAGSAPFHLRLTRMSNTGAAASG